MVSSQDRGRCVYELNSQTNPFKVAIPDALSRRASEIYSEEKEIPDTPMIEHKHISLINDFSQRESNFTQSDCKQTSRFNEDFNVVSILGKGQFGKVMRCKNKLD